VSSLLIGTRSVGVSLRGRSLPFPILGNCLVGDRGFVNLDGLCSLSLK